MICDRLKPYVFALYALEQLQLSNCTSTTFSFLDGA